MLAKATPGPWRIVEQQQRNGVVERFIFGEWPTNTKQGPRPVILRGELGLALSADDAELIANAPKWLALLLAERDAAKKSWWAK